MISLFLIAGKVVPVCQNWASSTSSISTFDIFAGNDGGFQTVGKVDVSLFGNVNSTAALVNNFPSVGEAL